jgi:FAD/FMN-containing dehydrogenase
VVLASGDVVLAKRDDSSTADLWDALRGGSTNFGIVTAVEMTCFPHPTLFRGANVLYLPLARKATLKALCNLGVAPFPEEGQPLNHAMWCITQYSGVKVINAILTTTGSPEQEKMHEFTSAWGRIPLIGRLHASTHGKFVTETGKLAPKGGSR